MRLFRAPFFRFSVEMRSIVWLALFGSVLVTAHDEIYGQIPVVSGPSEIPTRPLLEKDSYVPTFAGISTFAHLPYLQCWDEGIVEDYDIAVIGAPYDIGVTFRTGARFGPSGIREGSKRIKVNISVIVLLGSERGT